MKFIIYPVDPAGISFLSLKINPCMYKANLRFACLQLIKTKITWPLRNLDNIANCDANT